MIKIITILLTILILIIFLFILYIYQTYIKKNKIINYKKKIKNVNGFKNVPNIIWRKHSFNKDRLVSYSQYLYCHQKWIDLNPDFSIIWLNDNQCEKFMKSLDDKRIYNAYKKLKPGAFKCDLWRACWLYKYGGIYVDSYTEPYISIIDMIKGIKFKNNDDIFISAKDVDHKTKDGRLISGIHNGFMILSSGHPFMKKYIKDMIYNIENNFYGEHFLDVTGPLCLTRSINKVNGIDIDHVPKIGYNIFNNKKNDKDNKRYDFYLFKYHLDYGQNISLNGTFILRKKYSIINLIHEKTLIIVKEGRIKRYFILQRVIIFGMEILDYERLYLYQAY